MGPWIAAALLIAGTAHGAAGGPAPLADSVEFFVAPIASRIRPDGVPPEARNDAQLTAARGERESFFVVLRTGAVAPEFVEVRATALRSKTAEIPAAFIKGYRANFVSARGEQVADALVPLPRKMRGSQLTGKGLATARNVPFLIEVAVPRNASPGFYAGKVTLSADELSVDVPLSLRFTRARLPRVATLPTAFLFSGRDAALGSGSELDPAHLRDAGIKLSEAALAQRITLIDQAIDPPAYRETPGEGALALDFSDYDAALGWQLNGMTPESNQASTVAMQVPPGLSEVNRFKYAIALRRHLSSKGWAGRLIDLDGTDKLTFRESEGRPIDSRTWEECLTASKRRSTRERSFWRVPALSQGGALSLELGAPAISPRAIAWLAYRAGAAGLLYPEAVDGFRQAALGVPFAPAALFYPTAVRGPDGRAQAIESVRLKLLRDGLEDYELMVQARRAGHGALVDRWVNALAPDPVAFERDPALYEQARRELERAAEEGAGPSMATK